MHLAVSNAVPSIVCPKPSIIPYLVLYCVPVQVFIDPHAGGDGDENRGVRFIRAFVCLFCAGAGVPYARGAKEVSPLPPSEKRSSSRTDAAMYDVRYRTLPSTKR